MSWSYGIAAPVPLYVKEGKVTAITQSGPTLRRADGLTHPSVSGEKEMTLQQMLCHTVLHRR